MMKRMQRTIRFSAIAATATFLSVAILGSVANLNVAQAKSRAGALACGKQLQKQCGGVPVLANNLRECRKRAKERFPQDALHWRTMLLAVVRETPCNIAKLSRRVKAIFSHA